MITFIASLFTYTITIVVAGIIGLTAFLAGYLLPAIALFTMAKNAGHKYPWLAFIPIAQTYLEFTLPKRNFKIFNIVDTDKRATVAIISVIAIYFGSGIIAGLNLVPILGQLLDVALAVFICAVSIRKMYDIHVTFGTESEKALVLSIIGFFVPLVYAIFLLTIMKNEPEYGFGNYEVETANGDFSEI
ncbi:MAG: hypothetical protein J6X97_00325 [Lachnospiraceae bacterium]|nr:hypothetical protein [Lachnospiraceae bacterium]